IGPGGAVGDGGGGGGERPGAAARDAPRSPPVAPDELPDVALEISVLSEPVPLPPPVESTGIVVGRDGLIVRRGRHIGLLLPQVAREYRWGAEAFLTATCRKAGLPPQGGRGPGAGGFTVQAGGFGGGGGRAGGEGRGKRGKGCPGSA